MSTKPYHALSATLAGVALIFSAAFACAAPQTDAGSSATTPTVAAPSQPRSAERTAPSAAPVSMLVEDPAGNTVRLTHVPGAGWKYESSARVASPLRRTSFQPATAAATEADANGSLTIFIDGPSGFTYVWNRDSGWKFIGKLVDDTL